MLASDHHLCRFHTSHCVIGIAGKEDYLKGVGRDNGVRVGRCIITHDTNKYM